MRLDKFLAETYGCTRSQAKQYIRQGRVKVNGIQVTKPETKISEDSDDICLNEMKLAYSKFEYYMLNKPAGVVSATSDYTQKTVTELIHSVKDDLFPVGRLDKDTEGLLLITNNGELAHNLLSPKKHVDKKYYARIHGRVTKEIVQEFAEGIQISPDFTTLPARLEIMKSAEESEVFVTIREGKFHQIKRMFLAVGMEVTYLKRISMKNLVLDDKLKPGEYRKLTEEEIKELF